MSTKLKEQMSNHLHAYAKKQKGYTKGLEESDPAAFFKLWQPEFLRLKNLATDEQYSIIRNNQTIKKSQISTLEAYRRSASNYKEEKKQKKKLFEKKEKEPDPEPIIEEESSSDKLVCEICGAEYTSDYYFKLHQKNKHHIEGAN